MSSPIVRFVNIAGALILLIICIVTLVLVYVFVGFHLEVAGPLPCDLAVLSVVPAVGALAGVWYAIKVFTRRECPNDEQEMYLPARSLVF